MTNKLKGVKDLSEKKKTKKRMVNITINIPDIYDKNLKKLIKNKIIPNRSEGVRNALRDFFKMEHINLELLGFFGDNNSEKMTSGRKLGKPNFYNQIHSLKTEIKAKDNLINYLKSELEKHEKGEMNGNTK